VIGLVPGTKLPEATSELAKSSPANFWSPEKKTRKRDISAQKSSFRKEVLNCCTGTKKKTIKDHVPTARPSQQKRHTGKCRKNHDPIPHPRDEVNAEKKKDESGGKPDNVNLFEI